MGAIRTYNGEENLRRIKMQKSTTFVVVEGVDDVPIYESCLSHMAEDCTKYDVISADGKNAIIEYINKHSSSTNAVFIIDRDFQDITTDDPRLISLDRYSIENYFICSQVISHSLKFALRCKFQDALNAFDLEEFTTSITQSTEHLIKAIYYYQKILSKSDGERHAWSDTFLCEDNSWTLCTNKTEQLINKLLPTPEDRTAAENYFQENFNLPGTIIDTFPGKMLRHSLQRYIRQQVQTIRPSARGKYSDVETTKELLSAVIHKSDHIIRVLTPVARFIRERETG